MPITNEFSQQNFTLLQQLYEKSDKEKAKDGQAMVIDDRKQLRASVEKAFIEAFFKRDGASSWTELDGKIAKFKADAGSLLAKIESGEQALSRSTLQDIHRIALKDMLGAGMMRKPYETVEINSTANAISRYGNKPIRPGYGLVHIANKQGAQHADLFIETASKENSGWKRHSLIHATFGVVFPSGRPADFNPSREAIFNNRHTANLGIKETVFNANDGKFCSDGNYSMDAVSYADKQLLGTNEFLTLELPIDQIKKMTDYIFAAKHMDGTKSGLPIYQIREGINSKTELETMKRSAQTELDKIKTFQMNNFSKRFEEITAEAEDTDKHELIKNKLSEFKKEIETFKEGNSLLFKFKTLLSGLIEKLSSPTKPTPLDIKKLTAECLQQIQLIDKEQDARLYYYSAMKEQAQNKIDKIDFKTALDTYIKQTLSLSSYLSNLDDAIDSTEDEDGFNILTPKVQMERLFREGTTCIPDHMKDSTGYKEKEKAFLAARNAFIALKGPGESHSGKKIDAYLNNQSEHYAKKRQQAFSHADGANIIGISTDRIAGEWKASSVNCAGLCLRMLRKFSNIDMNGAKVMWPIGASSPQKLAQTASPQGFIRAENNASDPAQSMLKVNEAKSRHFIRNIN
ncbi:hypothetical protein [Chromobacterium sp. ATCC 53434]|uniref:hypothetical protein n=1 Tax=Chromobacterium sp. (strain ATCC 53434 / SC 14030) TaxID=2059672 RepID=UPI00130546BF|nr:hypothetical protein [Chromobacterium sp. ATCC 53434]